MPVGKFADMERVQWQSPIGLLTLEAANGAITVLRFDDKPDSVSAPERQSPLIREALQQLKEYFAGTRKAFALPLNPTGTDFQKHVWELVSAIPLGATASYLDIANQLGNANATRAVGQANGINPIPILIPCHRVIGADGKLTGYGGGLPRKRWLLNHEAQMLGKARLLELNLFD